MSDGEWRKQFTLGLTLALAAMWLWPVVWSLIPPLEYNPANYVTEIERDAGRENQDTYAQIWAAWAALAQSLIGFAGLIGLGFTAYYARQAWLEARDANNDTREQFRVERRPWVQVEFSKGTTGSILQDDPSDKLRVVMQATFKNVGLSPALHVFVVPHSLPDVPAENTRDILARAIAARRDERGNEAGYSLFPAQTQSEGHAFNVDWLRWDGPEYALGAVAGWVRYEYATTGKRHVTPFVLEFSLFFDEATGRLTDYTFEPYFFCPPPDQNRASDRPIPAKNQKARIAPGL